MNILQFPTLMYDLLPDHNEPNGFWSEDVKKNEYFYVACCLQHKYLLVSEQMADLLGYDPDEILNHDLEWWLSLIHSEDVTHVANIITQHAYIDDPAGWLNVYYTLEYRIRNKNGGWIWLREFRCLISLNGDGSNGLVLGRFENIGDEKEKLNKKLVALMQDAKHINPYLIVVISSIKTSKLTPDPDGRTVLTRREIEVLRLIGEGYSTKMIASKLFISINTVETHRRRLLVKMNVKNSMQLVRQASGTKWLRAG